jgi:hypothetical protein
MRRVLLGGLGLALGVFARPGLAQDTPARGMPPARTATDPANRSARLGKPTALPDAATAEGGVTPAGLFNRTAAAPPGYPIGQPIPAGQQYPVGQPIPVGQPYPVGQPVIISQGTPMVVPTPVPMTPMTTMPMTGGIQTAEPPSAAKPGTAGGPTITEIRPAPVTAPGLVVPQVGPAASGPGVCLDDPLWCPTPAGGDRVGRLCGGRFWITAEYLMWWTRSTQLPVLATTSSVPFNGFLGVGDTVPVLGGDRFGQTLHGGGRFGGVWWFTDQQCCGLDGRMFFLGRNGTTEVVNSNQYPLLARPFFNVNGDPALLPAVSGIRTTPVGSFSELVARPDLANGSVAAQLENTMWGAEANFRRALCCAPCARLDGIIGFRYLNFKEQLTVTETFLRTTPTSDLAIGAPALGGVISDRFRTENNFYGGQVGLVGEVRRGRWFVDGRGSIAFGTVNQKAEIAGGQALLMPGGTVGVYQGGLLALPGANIGTFSQNRFAVLPEVGVNVGYHLTNHLRVFVGYNFLYVSSMLRAADTVDTTVDAARVPNLFPPGIPVAPGVPRPAPQMRATDFFAQGINFGLQFTW